MSSDSMTSAAERCYEGAEVLRGHSKPKMPDGGAISVPLSPGDAYAAHSQPKAPSGGPIDGCPSPGDAYSAHRGAQPRGE